MPPAKRTVRRKQLADDHEPIAPRLTTTHTISRAYGRAVAGFTLVAILLAGVILMVTGSSATVVVTPKTSGVEVPFTIAVVAGDASSTNGALPGRLLELATSTSISIEIPASATTAAADPNAKAGGNVAIANRSGTPQSLVATTRLLSSDGKLFRLTAAVTVPANGQVAAQVLADEPGAKFAIPPTTFTIPGLNPARQAEVTASSDKPFTQQAVPNEGLTEAQIATAKASALAAAGSRLSKSLEGLLFSNEQLTPESVTTTALEFITSAKPGDAETSVTFSGTVRVSAILFNEQAMRRIAEATAREEYPGGEVEASSLTYDVQRTSGGQSLGTIAGKLTVRTTSVTLEAKDLTGRTKQDATVYVGLLAGVEEVSIKLRPSWFKHLPQDPSRITVTIESPNARQ